MPRNYYVNTAARTNAENIGKVDFGDEPDKFNESIYNSYCNNKEYQKAALYLTAFPYLDQDDENKNRQVISRLMQMHQVRSYYQGNDKENTEKLDYIDTYLSLSNNMLPTNTVAGSRYIQMLDELGGTVNINGKDQNTNMLRVYFNTSRDNTENGFWQGLWNGIYDKFTRAAYSGESTSEMYYAIFGKNNEEIQNKWGVTMSPDGSYIEFNKRNPNLIKIMDMLSMLNYENHVNGKSKKDRGDSPVVEDAIMHLNTEAVKSFDNSRFRMYAYNSSNSNLMNEIKNYDITGETRPDGRHYLGSITGFYNSLEQRVKNDTDSSYESLFDSYYGTPKNIDMDHSTHYRTDNFVLEEELFNQDAYNKGLIKATEYKSAQDRNAEYAKTKITSALYSAQQMPMYSSYDVNKGEFYQTMRSVDNVDRKAVAQIILDAYDKGKDVQHHLAYSNGMYGTYIEIPNYDREDVPKTNTKGTDPNYQSFTVFIPNLLGNEKQLLADDETVQAMDALYNIKNKHDVYVGSNGEFMSFRRTSPTDKGVYYINTANTKYSDKAITDEDALITIKNDIMKRSIVSYIAKNMLGHSNTINPANADKYQELIRATAAHLTANQFNDKTLEDMHNNLDTYKDYDENVWKTFDSYYRIMQNMLYGIYDKNGTSIGDILNRNVIVKPKQTN